jgi:prepilin-type processing-associated H-X9-DG protein
VDLLAIIVIVVVVAAALGFTHLGERGRTARCAGGLSKLGKAMNAYANENGDTIPAAGINLGKIQVSWDRKLFSYLDPGLANANSHKIMEVAPPFFACPSDTVPHREAPRSYAMAGNDMAPENWPPGKDSATGIGLFWDRRTVLALLDEEALQKPETLPSIKLSSIPAPADTVLLTEYVDGNNMMSSLQKTVVFGASQQRQAFKDGGAKFHQGKFNYLMSDGHVELLSPLQTGAFDGTAGIWSLKKGN